MNIFFTTLVVAVGLSMDAFSMALVYGLSLDKENKIKLSLIVGLFHFFMPLIGLFFGNVITKYLYININILMSIIFFIIGIDMLVSSNKEKTIKIITGLIGYMFFGLTVSIDSLTVGIGLDIINSNYLEAAFIFSIISCFFTYLGLTFGYKLKEIFGKLSTMLGGIILIFMALNHLFK